MITVAIGVTVGLFVGNRLSEKIQESVVTGLGLVTFFVGVSNASATGNVIIPLLSIAIGAIVGELINIERYLENFAGWLQTRFVRQQDSADSSETDTNDMSERMRFINGFITASLVFCVGPLTFVGSLQDGMGLAIGFQQLAIKSVLDMFAGMAFAASLGIGVMFSLITILVLQGGLALVGSVAGQVMSEPMINEMTAVGGLMLMGLALVLLDIKRPRMANYLPALVIAPLLVALAAALGINIYP
ncbi:MAG: DUF554 domain-containing protein [Anaerolineae bacterium]|nr:DUF554 domain-containing protein [Anaerolineae bacterium]